MFCLSPLSHCWGELLWCIWPWQRIIKSKRLRRGDGFVSCPVSISVYESIVFSASLWLLQFKIKGPHTVFFSVQIAVGSICGSLDVRSHDVHDILTGSIQFSQSVREDIRSNGDNCQTELQRGLLSFLFTFLSKKMSIYTQVTQCYLKAK